MITVTFYKKHNQQFAGFQVTGHADSVEEGADLVCCAVSVLTINTVNSIEAFTVDDFSEMEDEELGLIEIMFDGDISDQTQLLMDSYYLGITSMTEQYGSWLKVITKEEIDYDDNESSVLRS